MFCNQCEETAKGLGCTVRGVCGKDAETAGLQDVLIYLLKGLSVRNLAAIKNGGGDPEVGEFIAGCLFATLTNVNFDPARFEDKIREAARIRDALPPAGSAEPDACTWTPESQAAIAAKAEEIVAAREMVDADLQSLRDLLVFGLKGMGAYYHHASVLGYRDEEITTFLQEGLAATLHDHTADEMVTLVLKCGEIGVKTLALLDRANTAAFGTPEITTVSTGAGTRPGILVTGHDLKDLADLLAQAAGTGVDVYTHGEMLPAHAYPELKKYDHLVGNYGGSWPFQREEFERFNGPVLVTTNCLVPPKDTYRDRVYTTGPVGFAGVKHIGASSDGKKDFSPLIEHAKCCEPPQDLSRGDLVTGCAHAPVLAIADTVVNAVKSGAVKRFIVMAGCDGRYSGRDYYTRFAEALPADTIILTAGCAKYRYNSLGLGTIGGIPRVLDAGQCNDSYSLVVIAQALAKAFGVGVNELPVSYNIAWYEQKAVLVLLSLLSLGIKDITLGPRLPGFVSPGILKVLVENFGIKGITTVEEDLARMVPGN